MSPMKPRLSETGGRKSCGNGKEWKEKGQRHEWVKRELKIPNSGKIHHFRRKHSFFFLFSFFTFVLKFRMKASCFSTNFSHAVVVMKENGMLIFICFFDNFLYNMKEATVDQKIMKN